MGKKRVLVGYGVDIDAIAGWLGSYKGEDSTSDISRGELAPLVFEETHNSPLIRVLCRYRRHAPDPEAL